MQTHNILLLLFWDYVILARTGNKNSAPVHSFHFWAFAGGAYYLLRHFVVYLGRESAVYSIGWTFLATFLATFSFVLQEEETPGRWTEP